MPRAIHRANQRQAAGARRARPLLVVLAILPAAAAGAADQDRTGVDHYRRQLRIPPSLAPLVRHVAPGQDAFPAEKEAAELGRRLGELSALLREGPARAGEAAARLLAPDFKGARLLPVEEVSVGAGSALRIWRARALAAEAVLDRAAFAAELAALVAELRTVRVVELLITAIDVERGPAPLARVEVRYDIVGDVEGGGRAERLGRWQMQWRRGADGAWRVAAWTAREHQRSRAAAPAFVEATEAALGRNPAFRRQLGAGHDDWLSTLDSAFAADPMALHGISAGDADGDGLDDLYVAQPSGMPNRLFRNRGDGSFEDATAAAGLAVLDSTSQSAFADLDNDGDQDIVLVTRTGLLLFRNDGKGRFTRDPDAFRFQGRLRGSPTAVALADYDRDGWLDIYLCTYSYFIGASEDKAGPATPYHDARNGPPNLLLRNDGRGRFVDVTDAVGLSENNDRFTLAAAWADYDADGWPDLLVANDFGRKNLYRNLGAGGTPRFEDVAAAAGVEDHGAGMSATWLDYDRDGLLDIYTGNMWTAAGQRVTAQPGFMPEAPAEIRELYRRHTRGNSLLRNRGDGRFEDVTLAARAELGRWAWSSDAIDFDLDGWEDLYVVNGMFTRDGDEHDLDSFFWRQVVARSPLDFRTGTPFDDGWRAINRMLVTSGSQAGHERSVFLRNDGHGGFDEVAGSLGLDLEQDGRAYAVLDYDGDGDPDLAVYAPRQAPQLRLFRNDFPETGGVLALRLAGTRSNRDAVGARVSVETDDGARRLKTLLAGSGFLSQHSKELAFGLGSSGRAAKITVVWPSGLRQTFTDIPADHRVWIEEGSERLRREPIPRRPAAATAAADPAAAVAPAAPGDSWLYQPFPAPDFTLRDLDGQERSLSALQGRPVLLLFWSAAAPGALQALAAEAAALVKGGVAILAAALAPAADEAKVRAAARGLPFPVMLAGDDVAAAYTTVNRYLFTRREFLRLPTTFLLSGAGAIVKVYRGPAAAGQVLADVAAIDAPAEVRLARAVPFEGTFYAAPGPRNEFQYALELAEQGLEPLALAAFERVAEADPGPITLYNLATLSMKAGQPSKARAAFERALELKPDYAEASNSLGALLAQNGDVAGGIARFRAALLARPDFADAMNNLGYALFQSGLEQEAHELYERALTLQPDFPEALNNLGILFGQQGDMERAESYFRQAVEKRPAYAEAGNNLALVLAARGDAAGAIALLQKLLEADAAFEMTYVTLAKTYLELGRQRDALQTLEKLLQRNPSHPLALQILRQLRAGR